MKVVEILAKALLSMPLITALMSFSHPANASIPAEIQQGIQKRIVSGDYRELDNISITQDGVTSRLLKSDVDISQMLELLAKGDGTILNDPSLSYRLQLAGICRGGGADPDACEKWIRSPEYKRLIRRQEREWTMKCSRDKVRVSSQFGVFCMKDPLTQPNGPSKGSGDGSKAYKEYFRWDREERRRDAYCGPHKSVVDRGNGKWGCEPTG